MESNSLLTVETFIRDYEQNIAAGNMPAFLAQFADPFLAATPQGAKIVTAADHAHALPARQQLFDRMGCKTASLVDLHPIPLSARYTLVLTKWRMAVAGTPNSPDEIVFDSSFIVDTGVDEFKIIFYLANQNLVEVLQQHGIPQS